MRGFNFLQAVALLLIVGVAIAVLLPVLGAQRREHRGMQNNTQLRAIHQGMVVFSQGSKSGGGDGRFPGVKSLGGAALADNDRNKIAGGSNRDAWTFGNNNDIRGYDRNDNGDVDPEEMNDAATGEGFLQYVFAELLTGDFVPAGSSEYFLNPADTTKTAFIAGDQGDAGRFDMSKVSFSIVNVAAEPYHAEWRETINPDAIVLGDRAVGNGDTFGTDAATARSVWTDPGSGDWRGGLVRNDSSTETGTTYGGYKGLKYGDLTFEDGDVLNLFAHPASEDLELTDDGTIRKDQGVLFDQDERGKATGI